MKWHVETVEFSAGGGRLHGEILIPEGDGPFPGVVMCHGMASDHRAMSPSAQRLVRHGITVLTFDFRGHGKSEGILDSYLSQDVIAAVEHLRRHPSVDPNRTGLVGHSMGALAAIQAATNITNLRASVFISSPGDMDGQLADTWAPVYDKASQSGNVVIEYPHSGSLPMGGWFTGITFRLWMWIRGYRMRIELDKTMKSWAKLSPSANIERIGQHPKLFVQCKGDRWIPYEAALHVYERAKQPKKLILVDGGSHTTPLFPGKLRRKWITWLVSTLT